MKLNNMLFKILLQKFKEVYHLIAGCLLLSGLFYIRFVPRISRDLWENLNCAQLTSTLISVVFLLTNIYYLLVLLGYFPLNTNNSYFEPISLLFKRFMNYLLDILHNFYQFVWYVFAFLPDYFFGYAYLHYDVMRKLVKSFNQKSNHEYYFFC